MEGVNAVVLGFVVAGVVNAASRHDQHVRVLADVEIVVNEVGKSRFGHDDGDVDALALGACLDINVNAGLVRFGDDLNVFGALPHGGLAVEAQAEGALGDGLKAGDLGEHILLNVIQCHSYPPPYSLPVSTEQAAEVPSREGRISSRVPSRRILPSAMTMMRSAMLRMRSW